MFCTNDIFCIEVSSLALALDHNWKHVFMHSEPGNTYRKWFTRGEIFFSFCFSLCILSIYGFENQPVLLLESFITNIVKYI